MFVCSLTSFYMVVVRFFPNYVHVSSYWMSSSFFLLLCVDWYNVCVLCARSLWNERQYHFVHVNWESSRYILIGNPFSSRLASIHTADLPKWVPQSLSFGLCFSSRFGEIVGRFSFIYTDSVHNWWTIVFVFIALESVSFKCLYLHLKLSITLHLIFYSLLIGF